MPVRLIARTELIAVGRQSVKLGRAASGAATPVTAAAADPPSAVCEPSHISTSEATVHTTSEAA
jgi:hypothetical protein